MRRQLILEKVGTMILRTTKVVTTELELLWLNHLSQKR